jgi:hypothetical protein
MYPYDSFCASFNGYRWTIGSDTTNVIPDGIYYHRECVTSQTVIKEDVKHIHKNKVLSELFKIPKDFLKDSPKYFIQKNRLKQIKNRRVPNRCYKRA